MTLMRKMRKMPKKTKMKMEMEKAGMNGKKKRM